MDVSHFRLALPTFSVLEVVLQVALHLLLLPGLLQQGDIRVLGLQDRGRLMTGWGQDRVRSCHQFYYVCGSAGSCAGV